MIVNKKGLRRGLIILGILLHLYSLNHYQVYFAVFYTVFVLVMTVYLFWKHRQFHRNLALKVESFKEARLYEPPTDLPPMVLAYYLYGLDLVVLSPDGYAKWGISFNSLVQATLLDLLDRGVLQLTEGVKGTALSWVSKDSLEEFEVFFLRMIFGEQKEVPLDALFEARWSNLKADLAAEEVVDMKLRMYNRLSLDRMALSKLVEEATAKRRLPDFYRELSSREASFFQSQGKLGCLMFFLTIYLGVYAVSYLGILSLLVYLPCLWSLFGDAGEFKIKRGGKERLITEAGLQEIALWEAFKQMLADLKVFDQEGLRDHVLWNRYLVYGTLFGLAKQVEAGMKIAYPDSSAVQEDFKKPNGEDGLGWKKLLSQLWLSEK